VSRQASQKFAIIFREVQAGRKCFTSRWLSVKIADRLKVYEAKNSTELLLKNQESKPI